MIKGLNKVKLADIDNYVDYGDFIRYRGREYQTYYDDVENCFYIEMVG